MTEGLDPEVLDRAVGALVGLAYRGALGAPVEARRRGTSEPVTDALIFERAGMPAVGAYSFENPFVGQARIECSTFVESVEMSSGFFISDGGEPKLMSAEATDG